MNREYESRTHGSWLPTLLIVSILLLRWILISPNDSAVRIRRWFGMQKVKWRKVLGFRDNSKYKMGAGDGANQRYTRQG
jgi:hypothetical protein